MVDEDELEKLKEERKKELDESSRDDAEEDRREQVKELASKYLTKEARSRLGNIRAARPDLASSVEMQIARLGKSGQISEGQITDDKLKSILREVQKSSDQDTDIKFRR